MNDVSGGEAASTARWTLDLAAAAGLIAVIAAVYAPALRNDFVYDDYQLIVDQPAPSGVEDILALFAEPHCPQLPYYRPLARTTTGAQQLAHGTRPFPFQAFNLILACALGLAVHGLLRTRSLGIAPLPAFIASMVVVIHPVASCCVYSVSSGREALLCALMSVVAVAAFLRGGRSGRSLALLALGGALLSKEQGVVVPVLFLLADFCRLSPFTGTRTLVRWIVRYAPVLAVVSGYFVIRWQLFGGQEFDARVIENPVLSAFSMLFAVEAVVAPTWQLLYEPSIDAWLSAWRTIAALSGALAIGAWAVAARTRLGKRLWFWLGWMAIALLPTANIVAQEVAFAERWMLLFSVGAFGLVASLAGDAFTTARARARRARRARRAVATVAAVAAAVTIVIIAGIWATTLHRGSYFRDSETFCRQWLRSNPRSASAHAHLGSIAFREARHGDAIELLARARELCPGCEDVHWSLGHAYDANGMLEEAVAAYANALELNPHSLESRLGLGSVRAQQGRLEDAVDEYREALRIDPTVARGSFSLAVLLEELGTTDEAVERYAAVLARDPRFPRARERLARLLVRIDRVPEAVEQYRETVRRSPEDAAAHGRLANALLSLGREAEAIVEYEEVLRLEPESAEAHFNLGIVVSRQGNGARAVQHYAAALAIRPSWPAALNNLAWILAVTPDSSVRDPDRAIELAENLCEGAGSDHAVSLDTLAAAYAASGRFGDALAAARRARKALENTAGNSALADAIEERVRRYEARQPWRSLERVD